MTQRRATEAEGDLGAVATAHPAACRAGVVALEGGGSAADAAIAAQAVLCVVAPHACGLGGDLLALVRDPGGAVTAVNGTGRSARAHPADLVLDGGPSATVPGIVAGWADLHSRFGRLPWHQLLEPAIQLAVKGTMVDRSVAAAVEAQRSRLIRGGAGGWDLLRRPKRWHQPALASLLDAVATGGVDAFYGGAVAEAIAAAVARDGGGIDTTDLADHRSSVASPVTVSWAGGEVHVQPPSSQGVLLAAVLQALERDPSLLDAKPAASRDHVLVEATNAVFEVRDACADVAVVLDHEITIDPERASRSGGPRAYLHTAGTATVDADGQVVSSLVSVFDDFGAGTFVSEHGFVLNNRAAGFTTGANAPRPSAFPVHTLAPALITHDDSALALATPGADGQVQTLLQVLVDLRDDAELGWAVTRPRWRSEEGTLLIEAGHPAAAPLQARGHRTSTLPVGDDRFGAVVAALHRPDDPPTAVGDWRRNTATAAATRSTPT